MKLLRRGIGFRIPTYEEHISKLLIKQGAKNDQGQSVKNIKGMLNRIWNRLIRGDLAVIAYETVDIIG